MKTCSVCQESKDLAFFPMNGKYRRAQCDLCWKAYRREYVKKRHHTVPGLKEKHNQRSNRARQIRMNALRDAIWQMKDKPCKDCGRKFHPHAMDFDHLDATSKLANVAALANKGQLEQAIAEAEKCDLVCAVCHRLRTRRRQIELHPELVSPFDADLANVAQSAEHDIANVEVVGS